MCLCRSAVFHGFVVCVQVGVVADFEDGGFESFGDLDGLVNRRHAIGAMADIPLIS